MITTLSNCDQKTGVIVAISSILCLVFVVTILGKWNTKTRISGVAATLVGAAFLFGFSRDRPELPAASNGQPQTVVQAPIEKQDKERKEGSGDTGKSKEKDSPQVIAKQPEKIDGQVVKTPDKPKLTPTEPIPLKYDEIVFSKMPNTVVTEDYFPHRIGTDHVYDREMRFPRPDVPNSNTTAGVIRTRENCLEGGLIEQTQVKIGVLENGRIRWLDETEKKSDDPPNRYKIDGGFIRVGIDSAPAVIEVNWMPVLKIGAKVGEQWRYAVGEGFSKTLNVEAFG